METMQDNKREKTAFIFKCAALANKKLTKAQQNKLMSADDETLQHTAKYLMVLAFGKAVDDMIKTRKASKKSGGILDGIIADTTEETACEDRDALRAEYNVLFESSKES